MMHIAGSGIVVAVAVEDGLEMRRRAVTTTSRRGSLTVARRLAVKLWRGRKRKEWNKKGQGRFKKHIARRS